MNRRKFLGCTALAGSIPLLHSLGTMHAETPEDPKPIGVQQETPFADNGIFIPDDGWRMWPDTAARWQDDSIFLPDDVKLHELPVNAPTGGWGTLSSVAGTELTLPSTVEQYHWGLSGFRPYHDEYQFESDDDEVRNGAYYGVSWWWRDIDIPERFLGRRVLLHVRGARQRAEVYLNQKLVGYSIMEELPFECDLSAATVPGRNQIGIRITNPGGRLDWVDGRFYLTWGGMTFQKSHGFGGLDRALMLSAHDDVRIRDLWALNTPNAATIAAHVQLENRSGAKQPGTLRFSIIDPETSRVLASLEKKIDLEASTSIQDASSLTAPGALTWDLDSPKLYKLQVAWHADSGMANQETRSVDFGFRWFHVDGLGGEALFRLNGRRIRLYTSISWGYWGLNGLFPIPELAEKEVRVAKSFNLNTLNFHRNLAKEDVLYVQDRLGLLRCLEPGGGSQAAAPVNAKPAELSAARYMHAKIKGMIRAFRSHPSAIHYILQNEGVLDPTNPNLDEIFKMMHEEDPSRSIVGTDGFVLRSRQAWIEAYGTEVHKSLKPATVDGGAAGWWVDHTGHFSDIWQDGLYTSPTDFYFYTKIASEITEWGEMKGASAIDNHAGLLRQIASHGGKSYDLLDHEEVLQAYELFLDRWKFRAAFPTCEQLFLSIGRRAYETWGQFMENVRLCDNVDMAAISGWESTAIENHSGLLDNFRDYKADPKVIAESLLPIRPIAKQHQLVVATGQKATFDLFLLNDTGKRVDGKLTFTSTDPGSVSRRLAVMPAPALVKDRFSYLLREGFITEALEKEGKWRFRLRVDGHPGSTFEREILVVSPVPKHFKPVRVGLAALAPLVEEQLRLVPGLTVEPFRADGKYDVILGSGGSVDAEKNIAVDAEGAYKPGAGPAKRYTLPGEVLEAVKSGTPLLACTPSEGQAIGIAQQLSEAGAFQFHGMVGPSRATWMGSWYFVREHPLYDGLPVNQAMSIHYQVKGAGSNGWLVEGEDVEVVVGYSRDHDRRIGAGTFTAKLNKTPIVMHQVAEMHPVFLRRFLANSITELARGRQHA